MMREQNVEIICRSCGPNSEYGVALLGFRIQVVHGAPSSPANDFGPSCPILRVEKIEQVGGYQLVMMELLTSGTFIVLRMNH